MMEKTKAAGDTSVSETRGPSNMIAFYGPGKDR